MKTTIIATFACTLIATTPNAGFAQTVESEFTFSETLQASLDSFQQARTELREDVYAALEGLTREEARDVRQSFAEQVHELREEGRALREAANAELEAAGVERPERPAREERAERGAPERGAGGPGRGGEGRGPRG
ncbi:MAG: hypothetical protein ACR2O8_15665 [Rhizobiaceae bacterium]